MCGSIDCFQLRETTYRVVLIVLICVMVSIVNAFVIMYVLQKYYINKSESET